MNCITITSLSLIVFAQAMTAFGQYTYVRRCKDNTEACLSLRCSYESSIATVPFKYHYSCCAGKIVDDQKYICTKRHGVTRVEKCDVCNNFKCNDGQCTLRQWRCNGVKDCTDGSDEIGCSSCPTIKHWWLHTPLQRFRCKTGGQCVSRSAVCDKINHCSDGSDEFGCRRLKGGKCGPLSYRCKNDQCILGSKVCDGRNDCGDNSDEFSGCRKSTKRNEILNAEEFEQNDESGGGKAVDAAKGTL